MRDWKSALVLILTYGFLPLPILAQEKGHTERSPQFGCFRGRPLPACKSFWIIEFQASEPVAQTSRTVTETYPGFDA
jgi:hypothetical protein